ncbi:hypothetical protein RIF29_26568 [Crotalaria pallida]|uniref:Uncharacterized protein n=1 Tax=Crotalaria pallida TaxID=3830 RepID=A0AAN9I0F4_CROPI
MGSSPSSCFFFLFVVLPSFLSISSSSLLPSSQFVLRPSSPSLCSLFLSSSSDNIEKDDCKEAASKVDESTSSDESSGDLIGNGSNSNYLVSSSEVEDRNIDIRDEVSESCEDSEAHHRFCAWHLSRNAIANVKNKHFTKGFNRCMFYDYEVDEFEVECKALVRRCRVRKNKWVANVYDKKEM